VKKPPEHYKRYLFRFTIENINFSHIFQNSLIYNKKNNIAKKSGKVLKNILECPK